MWIIKDQGKVWFPGAPRPFLALRVNETVFALGEMESENIEFWIENDFLCLDLHNPKKKCRMVRRFPLKLHPTTRAILFSGFEKTKHEDVKVVTKHSPEVDEWIINGENYEKEKIEMLDTQSFWIKMKLLSNRKKINS